MKIGLGSTDITPPMGIEMVGYHYDRHAEDVHDKLWARTICFDDGRKKAAIISCDICFFEKKTVDLVKEEIAAQNLLPWKNIILCACHTHTGPVVSGDYERYLVKKIAESLKTAQASLTNATLSAGTFPLPKVCFNRRYWMKDGTVVTNPGKCNPGIVRPAGPAPTEAPFVIMNLEKNNGASCLLVNIPLHPDTIAGNLISADYPYYIADEIKKRMPSISEVIYANGTSGNINHWDVADPGLQRGFNEAERIGRAIGNALLASCPTVKPAKSDCIAVERQKIKLPVIKVSKEELLEAERILLKPYPPGVDFTMEVVHAKKLIRAAGIKDDSVDAEITAVGVGDVVFVGMPAELFVELGIEITRKSPFLTTVIMDLSYGCIGYIATPEAYEQGGYEVVSNIYMPEAGSIVVDATLQVLNRLRSKILV